MITTIEREESAENCRLGIPWIFEYLDIKEFRAYKLQFTRTRSMGTKVETEADNKDCSIGEVA